MTGFAAYPRATTWLYETLTTPAIDDVVGVYEDAAPQDAVGETSRWIEFEEFGPGQDVAEIGEQRIWTEFAFLVRGVMRGRSTQALKDIADAIDTRLHRANGVDVGDGLVLSCVRDQEHHDSWLEMGVEYRGLGGLFHIIVQPAG